MAGDKNKLTEKQRQILEYLKQEILQRGFPPSVREICEAVSLRSATVDTSSCFSDKSFCICISDFSAWFFHSSAWLMASE